MNKIRLFIFITGMLLATGCTKEEKVPMEKHFWAPNSFSPNNDGLNEHFQLNPIYGTWVRDFHIKIFTSQLQEVYRCDDFSEMMINGWDGKYQDIEMPAGYYEYQVIYTAAEDSVHFAPYVSASAVNLLR